MGRRIWLFVRVVMGLFSVALLTSSAPPSTAPGIGDKLFQTVKSVLADSVDPDTIEMARFSIANPEEAAMIYSRAAAQDYPFFGLIGSVKAARKAGFTHQQCMTPITAIDTVFAKASSTIDSGKTETDGAMGAAQSIAADYAKATTEQGKQQAVEALAANIPYFGDIQTICDFAFGTDFVAEKNFDRVVNQASQDVRTAYFAFKSGDVYTGATVLIRLGISNEAACKLVDTAVSGGVITRTPVLGSLAKSVCGGFVGTVIDGATGIIKGGVGIVEAGVTAVAGGVKSAGCAIYSLIGSGCSSDPAPPPTAFSTAAAWCEARGGIGGLLSKTNQPDDYSLQCNDGSTCRANPGLPVKCATGAEIAAHRAQELAIAQAEYDAGLPGWQASFDTRWSPKCQDVSCHVAVAQIQANASQRVQADHQAMPAMRFQTVSYFTLEAADRQAASVIDESSYRVLPPRWAKSFGARWSERCEDDHCRAQVKLVIANVMLQVQQRAAATPMPPYGATAPIYALAEGQGTALAAESTQRIAAFNKETTANASAAWEIIQVSLWSKKCADPLCLPEIKKIAAQMRLASNLIQMGDPELSSLQVQNKVVPEFTPKFQAAVAASKDRAAAKTPVVAPTKARAVRPIQAFLQPRRVADPSAAIYDGARPVRPVPRGRPPILLPNRPSTPRGPVVTPTNRPVILQTRPVLTPAPGPIRIITRPTPTPTPTPTGGRPPPIPR